MSRLVRRWVALGVFGAVMATAFVLLGNWQLSRLEERRAGNAVLEANAAADPKPYADVMTGDVGDEDQYQRVTVKGTYRQEQFQVRMRSVNGVYGSEIVAVLVTAEGDNLLVDRGLVPREGARPEVDVPPLPEGEVSVTGYVRRNEQGLGGEGTPHEGQVRLIDSRAIGDALGVRTVDGYVALIDSAPSENPALSPVGMPEITEGNHFSYALQWFAFTIIGIVGIAVLVRGDLRDRRKALAKKRAAQQSGAEPSNDASARKETG